MCVLFICSDLGLSDYGRQCMVDCVLTVLSLPNAWWALPLNSDLMAKRRDLWRSVEMLSLGARRCDLYPYQMLIVPLAERFSA